MNVEPEHRAPQNVSAELDVVEADGNQVALWIVEAGGNVGVLVDPTQQTAAEKEAIVVQVFWHYQLVIFQRVAPGFPVSVPCLPTNQCG